MKPYVKILVKQNLAYFLILFFMIVGTLAATGYLYTIFSDTHNQIALTKAEISTLSQRQELLQSLSHNNTQELTDNLAIMNNLIPNSEDYFSIIYALDQLSKKTGFIINSYVVDLTASKQDRLALSVSGIGDPKSFLEFLKDYNTGGGRLITAETIQLDSANSSNIKLQLYFYNKAAAGDNAVASQSYKDALKNFEKIRTKVSVAVTNEEQPASNTEQSYTLKSDPF